jgi:hypothetical protein
MFYFPAKITNTDKMTGPYVDRYDVSVARLRSNERRTRAMVVSKPPTMYGLSAPFALPRSAASALFLSIVPTTLAALPHDKRYVGQLDSDFYLATVPR